MRITFYYDDLPTDCHRRLLRLDNAALARGYATHLRRSLKPEAQAHVRVQVETVDGDTIRTGDMTLNEYERRADDSAAYEPQEDV